jgi:hypothetical protein
MTDAEREIVDHYNLIANQCGLTRCRILTQARRRAIIARAKDCGGDYGLIIEALDRLKDSSFCQGHNDRGWKANLDFVLQASSFTKLLEGFYEDRPAVREMSNMEKALQRASEILNGQSNSDSGEADSELPQHANKERGDPNHIDLAASGYSEAEKPGGVRGAFGPYKRPRRLH